MDETKDPEAAAALEALNELPVKLRKFYDIHYQLIGSEVGSFVGLVCKCCNRFREYMHDEDCPVKDLEE